MLATLPYQSCMGNHEGSGVLFEKYFPYPFVEGRYWSFDYGLAHLVVVDQYPLTSAQLTWIENDLASRPSSWNFIIFHEPGWSAGNHANNTDVQDYIQPLCEQYNVHAVFAGHNHYYARALYNDVHHITTGGGGAPLSTPNPAYPYIVAYEMAYHFCKVEIDGSQLTITAVDIDGKIIDSFSIEDQSLPVELSHFVAYQEKKFIVLEWTTETEVENLGFILERKESHNDGWQEIASYITCPELEGQGSIPYRTEYRYEDITAEIGKTYDYRLVDVSYNGTKQYHSMITPRVTFIESIPSAYELFQNYPNPFNPTTVIRWHLAGDSDVELSVYNLLGQKVVTLVSKSLPAGSYQVEWDASGFTSGIYYYRIEVRDPARRTGEFQDVKKMILIR
jgi:hypothetical protein